MSGKVVDLSNYYIVNGRLLKITPRNMRKIKTMAALAGVSRPGGDCA
jgi:hypothetical protein